ncbi:MAG: sucD 2, partial [Burkholderiales bacterium]|nr:sucD 2 [Burkholderiales bacterium]
MPSVLNHVERGRYLDSVALMRLSRRLATLPGVEEAALMIGSPSNKALLREARLLAPQGEAAGPNDLVIAVRAADERSARAALDAAWQFLQEKPSEPEVSAIQRVRSMEEARANLALIS